MKSKDAVNNFLKSAGSKAGCKLTSIEENSELSSGGSSSEPTVVRPLGPLGPLGSQRSVSSMSTQSTSSPSMGSSATKRTSRASSDLPSLGNRETVPLFLVFRLKSCQLLSASVCVFKGFLLL